jgi:hypothetical protein
VVQVAPALKLLTVKLAAVAGDALAEPLRPPPLTEPEVQVSVTVTGVVLLSE